MRGLATVAPRDFSLRALRLLAWCAAPLAPTLAAPGETDIKPEQWAIRQGQVVEHLGRRALAGAADLKEVQFENGVIEVDVALTAGVRSYPGVVLRVAADGDYERIYLRPHRSTFYSDAVQYLPAFRGADSWQLYSGPGFTGGAVLPTGQWLHLKIEVAGTQARVFLGDSPDPVLVVPDLKHGRRPGGLGLMAAADGSAFFSNFSWRADDQLRFDPPPKVHPRPGLILDWEISPPQPAQQFDEDVYPDLERLGPIRWRKIVAEPDGLVDVARHFGRSGPAPEAILARTTIHADGDELRKFWFGYSDAVAVFLNRRPLFYGLSAYRSREPSFLGVVGLFDAVHLPLRRGANELLLIVAETIGGWGFMVQDGAAVWRAAGVTPLWETPPELLVPESAVFDARTNAIYVSNFDGYNRSQGAGRQFVSKLTPTGAIAALRWVTGLNNPVGLTLRGDRLYAVESTGIAEIDIDSARIVRRRAAPGGLMLNDVAVADNGEIFVSDTRKNAIWRFTADGVEEWLAGPAISAPNGLYIQGDQLIVGTMGDNCLKRIDLATKEVAVIADLGVGAIDGVTGDGAGNFLVSHFEGRLFRVTPGGQVTLLLDLSGRQTSIADFGYAAASRMIFAPTFGSGRVTAHRLP